MDSGTRLILCAFGFLFPLLFSSLFQLPVEPFVLANIIFGCIVALVIFFVTGGELSPSKSIEKEIDGTTVILLYILSFFIPLAGFIVGAIYASKDEEHYKHVGKNCLIFSVINIVLGFIMIVAIIAG